jgi:hypothetical protein
MAGGEGALAQFSLIGGPFHALSTAIAPRLGRAARVAFLSPKIQRAILEGT